ncbi:hypothetical protein [Arthrobacter sp. ISL-30]|uniref:hypothetical protein n=1 Tax=Arthrobacter sp. ISL-30 TaxID=2819109 RepID=UPI001BEC9E86|nr:hypothetical protein [Arthrobacter sp. ISL-30]MBT2515657.1 hypothetical protein [Arthrobacter sp. ISL-30]
MNASRTEMTLQVYAGSDDLHARLDWSRWLWLALAAVIVAEALRAHPQQADPALGIPITALRLAAAALWTGMFVHMLRTLVHWRDRRDPAWKAVGTYSRTAAWPP